MFSIYHLVSELKTVPRNATSSRYTLFDDGPILSTRPGKWDSTRVSNPAAVIYPNGSVLLAYRGNGKGRGGVGVAVAPHWKGPYTHLCDEPLCELHLILVSPDPYVEANVPTRSGSCLIGHVFWCMSRAVSGYAEDPTLYFDANGLIHMIAHGASGFSCAVLLLVVTRTVHGPKNAGGSVLILPNRFVRGAPASTNI